jgi:hypothetical protein
MNEAGPPLHLRLQTYLMEVSHRAHLPTAQRTGQCGLRPACKTFLSFRMYSVTSVFRLALNLQGPTLHRRDRAYLKGVNPADFLLPDRGV